METKEGTSRRSKDPVREGWAVPPHSLVREDVNLPGRASGRTFRKGRGNRSIGNRGFNTPQWERE